MNIYEIPFNVPITVTSMKDLHAISFNTMVVERLDSAILLAPMEYEGKMVKFKSDYVSTELLVFQDDSTPILFKDVEIASVRYKGNLYHAIRRNFKGIPFNRRKYLRIWIGADGILQIGDRQEKSHCTVRDVSIGGFAIVCTKGEGEEPEENTRVCLRFKEPGTDEVHSVQGRIVRKIEDMPNGEIMFGCKLDQESDEIASLVYRIQRERLQSVVNKVKRRV